MAFHDDLIALLAEAAHAPSGGNSRPWSCVRRDMILEVHAHPERDHRILNVKHRGTLIAVGAFVEAVCIAAPSYGYTTSVVLFPDSDHPLLVAAITFTQATVRDHSLRAVLTVRATNRRPYELTPLTVEQRTAIAAAATPSRSHLTLIDQPSILGNLGRAFGLHEAIMLRTQRLHELFFNEVAWSRNEEARREGGLLIDTLELALPQRLLFRLFRYWPIQRIANLVGMHTMIAAENASIYARVGALALWRTPADDAAYVDLGQTMLRVWLTATAQGLAAHLVTGTMFFAQALAEGTELPVDAQAMHDVRAAYAVIDEAAAGTDGYVALAMRLGTAPAPSAVSRKWPPELIVATP